MKKTLALSVTLLLAAGLSACSSDTNNGAAPTAEAEATTSPAPSESPTVGATSEVVNSEESTATASSASSNNRSGRIQKLKEMPLDEFKELSIEQRSVLVTDMLEYSTEWDIGRFGEGFDEEDSSKLYEFNPLDVASKGNSAKEIAMQDLYMHQLALSQTVEHGKGTFDPELASKALSGAYIDIEFTHSGKETFTDGNNLLFADWQKTFNSLSDVTTHEFPQAIETAKITESTTIPDDNGNMLTVVSVEYTTEELPETLGSYPEGRKMAATKDFVWSEEANMWLSYKGGFSMLPAGN